MHLKFFAALGAAAFLLILPARANAACCDQGHHDMKMACCEKADMDCCKDMKDMACCDTKDNQVASAIDMLLSLDPQLNPLPPVRQETEVFFQRPTLVGRTILQGRYVIQHDNDRMARGEPCTYIFSKQDLTKPVATFHCVHIERDRAGQNVVVLATNSDGWNKLEEFQFAGESAAHGYPSTIR